MCATQPCLSDLQHYCCSITLVLFVCLAFSKCLKNSQGGRFVKNNHHQLKVFMASNTKLLLWSNFFVHLLLALFWSSPTTEKNVSSPFSPSGHSLKLYLRYPVQKNGTEGWTDDRADVETDNLKRVRPLMLSVLMHKTMFCEVTVTFDL